MHIIMSLGILNPIIVNGCSQQNYISLVLQTASLGSRYQRVSYAGTAHLYRHLGITRSMTLSITSPQTNT
jgi:hypothetical protein